MFHDTGTVDQLHRVSRTAGDQSGGGICAITENKSVLYQVEISQIDQSLVFSEGHCTEGVREKVTMGHIENSQNHL